MRLGLTALALCGSLAAALPVSSWNESTTCGDQFYSAGQVSEAMDEACRLFEGGDDVNDYPHTYNNYEGFEFKGYDGPFQEFPIVSGGAYDGGSPGPDRVVITEDGCKLAGVITHTGADGNAFVACDGTS